MDLIRRDTDYAFRLAARLAVQSSAGPISAKQLSQKADVPYPITCKLLQKLAAAGIVNSIMGAKGGFVLSRPAEHITFGQVIEAVQGKPTVIRCLLGGFQCPHKGRCPVNPKLADLQKNIDDFFGQTTLSEFVKAERSAGDE